MKRPNQSTLDALLNRAIKSGVDARLIKNVKSTERKSGPMGSTSRPPRVIMMGGKAYSLRNARLHLDARERKAS